jgi:hypothetical protein
MRHAVGMQVAVAEDDDLLLRPAVAHRRWNRSAHMAADALGQHQVVVEALGHVVRLQIVGRQVAAGARVDARLGASDLLAGEGARRRWTGFSLHDFAGGQVAVFLRLDQRVLVDRLAESRPGCWR